MSYITREIINQSYTYNQFRKELDELLKEGKTTGENHSEDLVKYTKMNLHRMKRLEKKPELNEELKKALDQIENPQIWFVLVEGWCGDVAQNLPTINKMAEYTDKIELRLVLRDEHLDIMDQYLTNGTRSIPKLVSLDKEALDELWTWGPRPVECQNKVEEMKQQEMDKKEMAENIHHWYAKDNTESLQKEFARLVQVGELQE